jgi:hypothetical protein
MALTFSGVRGASPEFETLLEAFDGEKRVVVITSAEAIEDFGLGEVQRRAAEKYDAGHREDDGRVRVTTVDFT